MPGGKFTLYTLRLQPHKITPPPPKKKNPKWDSKLLSCQSILWYIHDNMPDGGMQIDGRRRILIDLSD